MRSIPRSLVVFWLLFGAAGALAGQAPHSPDPALPWAGESIDVDLRTVPFYAVDAEGNPVTDLRADEVRLSIDGRPVPVEVFALSTGAAMPSPGTSEAPPAAIGEAPRHVFLLLDVLFSSPGGLLRAKIAAQEFARELGPRDRIHLIVNRRSGGFIEVLGPVRADQPGLAALDKALAAELPDIGSVRADLGDDIPEPLSGARHGNDNIKVARWAIGDMGRAEYRSAAEDLAGGLAALATRLQTEAGPKLLVMLSGGVNSELYFHGWERLGTGSSASSNYQSGFRPQTPLRYRFEGPLKALVEAGIQTAFVEVDSAERGGRESMAHLGEATGGLFLEGTNAKDAAARLARRTSALYEIGWYGGEAGVPLSGRVEVVSLRPGVELWSAQLAGSRLVSRRVGPDERRFVIVDLVHRGLDPRAAAAAERERVLDLSGQIGTRTSEQGKTLVFAPTWPAALRAQGAELYEVLLRLDRKSGKMSLIRFERSTPGGAELPSGLSPRLEGEGPFVWGIVAIDRDRGTTWLRRLMLESPRADAAAAPPVSR